MIKLQSVSKEYIISDEVFKAVDNATISIEKGEFSAIQGPSGSGKSTLMHIMGLLDPPSKGKVVIRGKDISKLSDDDLSTLRNEFVGFVFQQFNLINKMTVMENVLLPVLYARKKLSFNPAQKALTLMEKFGIKDKNNEYPNKLSGGQQQRVAITRALIMSPQVVMADEPTGNLDSKTGAQILKLLEDLNKKNNVTVIVVTHESDVAKRARRIIKIFDGIITDQ